MISPDTDRHPDDFGSDFAGFHRLLPNRVQDLLLVCSLYESFILEEDGLLTDLISSEYVELNLSHAPRVSRASTGPRSAGTGRRAQVRPGHHDDAAERLGGHGVYRGSKEAPA